MKTLITSILFELLEVILQWRLSRYNDDEKYRVPRVPVSDADNSYERIGCQDKVDTYPIHYILGSDPIHSSILVELGAYM